MIYDLEERVEDFGENIIDLAKKVRVTPITKSIIEQLVASGCSIGANYFEANGASSKKRFSKQNLYRQKRSERNPTLVANACKSRTNDKRRSKKIMERSL